MSTRGQRLFITAVIAAGSPMLLVLALRELNQFDDRPYPAEIRAEGGLLSRFVAVRVENVSRLEKTTPSSM
jgi:hypothetical protein